MSKPRAADGCGWLSMFPKLARLDPDARGRLLREAQVASLPAGAVVFHDGDRCERYLMVLEGSVRVQMVAESGREVVLYRVGPGETCILTTACLLAGDDYGAEALSETPVRAVTLPGLTFDHLLATSPAFRRFVFASYGNRIGDLMLLIQEVAFRRVDGRLGRFLLDHRDAEGCLELTHQALAKELGTVREVVSRLLKEFERRGLVVLGRGHICVTDAEGLRRLSDQSGL